MAKLPTVTSNIPRDLRTFVDRVREALDTGGPDAVITARQLVAAGVATYTGNVLGPAGSVRYSTPPRPQNVEAEGALANIMVTWDKPVYTGHAYAEIWASTQTPEQEASDTSPTIGEAELVGMSPGVFFAHNLGAAAKRWYWVRFVNFAGEAGPYQSTEGVVGETSLDPEYVLEVLTGAITQSQLYSELSTKVDRIDTKTRVFRQETAPTGTAENPLADGDIWINTTITYYDDYSTGDYVIRANRMNRWDADASEWVDFMDFGFQDWFTAINTEKTTRETEDAALAQQITTVSSAVGSANAAIDTEQTARSNADSALATSISTLTATVTNNAGIADAAVTAEQSARVSADSALASDITTLTATVATNAGLATAGITAEREARVDAGYASASDVTNLISVVDTNNITTLAAINAEASTRSSADSTMASDISTIQADYLTSADELTINAAISAEALARSTADGALSQTITTLEASVGLDISAAVAVESSARATADGNIEAKNTVKIDVAGHVSGYGLISTLNDATPTSEFGIRADTFFLAPPTNTDGNAPTQNVYPGFVWLQNGDAENYDVKYYTGSGWSTTPQNLPFVVRTSPTTINGESVPAGVYMQDAYIANGTITNAKIGNAAIDDAKIANLDAGKITTGFLDGNRIEASSIDANMIDSRGLSIKDANGNIILAAGSPLAVGNVSGLGGLATLNDISMSYVTDAGGLAGLNEVSYSELETGLAGLIDGKVEQHYGASDPSTVWTSAAIKDDHVGDLWYHTTDKLLYVWIAGDDPATSGTTETHHWQKIENQDAIDAASAASTAQDAADGKRRVFTAQPTAPYDAGDLWDRGSTTGLWRCVTTKLSTQSYAFADWQVVADTTGNNTAASITGQGALATADDITMSSVTDAGSFATLSQITTANVSTYIGSAAIKLANIDTATITNLASIKADMGTITAGVLKSSDNKFVIDLNNKTISIET